ncbi:MAG: hypothetical protein A2138_08775 [Deltaproteobacteria bacterium RBG_16_71_12]|nr:MAG: hypothetical protein A2138_08775 [Deltaproteobacteria bacterium RBG_16_71_12]
MRRLPLPVLAVLLIAAAARAEEPAAPAADIEKADETRAFGPKAAPDENSAAPAPAAPTAATPPGAAPAAAAAPAVAPAAKIDEKVGEDEESDDKFPLHVKVGLSNSASNAWLAPTSPPVDIPINGGSSQITVPGSNGMMQPNWSTSLSLKPSASIPKLADWMPRMNLGGSMSFSVGNWLPAYANSGAYDRQIKMSDFGLSLGFGQLFKEEVTGIGVSAGLSSSIPLSLTSRFQNKITSLGGNLSFGWDGPEWDWGQVSAGYSTGLRGNFYSQDASTIPCEAGVSLAGVVENPLENGDLPLQYSREVEIAENGECMLRGRQGLASLNNGISASWSLGDHSVSTDMGWNLGFMRPLSNRPELSSPFATGQNFSESWSGNLSYAYKVPVDFTMNVSAGVGSEQSVFDPQGNLRFPFFDFFHPANGFSSAFVNVSVGI